MRILVVEDEPTLRAQLVDGLQAAGYVTDTADNGVDAHYLGETEAYDAVLLDLGLPRMDGISVLKKWRAAGRTMPVLILTARDGWHEKVSGIDAGADDYLSKAISLPQLTARVNALLRRIDALRAPAAQDSVFVLRGLRLELERLRVCWNEVDVPLTVTEFWMVHAMVRRPGHVKSREQLMREAQIEVDEATVTSHIKRARRKFEAIDPAFDEIDTVHGAGYRWRP